MRRQAYLILVGLSILAFGLNAAGIVAAIHGFSGDLCRHQDSTHHSKNPSDKPDSSHHRSDCALCQLLASTTGKIHLINDASDEGVERYVFCLTLPDDSVHRWMIRQYPSRGPPAL